MITLNKIADPTRNLQTIILLPIVAHEPINFANRLVLLILPMKDFFNYNPQSKETPSPLFLKPHFILYSKDQLDTIDGFT
jgi:hypothetical protein